MHDVIADHPLAEREGFREALEALAFDAGRVIMKFYRDDSFQTADKLDGSPVTSADLAANELIQQELRRLEPSLPVVSEEGFDPAVDRRQMQSYWLVDPLDGTKEFIKRSDEFTVNIALIWRRQAVAGVVYCPAKELMYTAWAGRIYRNRKVFPSQPRKSDKVALVALCSLSHQDEQTEKFLSERGIETRKYLGSSLKFCRLLDGDGDFYIRYTPTSEWDTAAGQAVCEVAGFQCLSLPELKPLIYSKVDIRNPSFIVARPELIKTLFPEC